MNIKKIISFASVLLFLPFVAMAQESFNVIVAPSTLKAEENTVLQGMVEISNTEKSTQTYTIYLGSTNESAYEQRESISGVFSALKLYGAVPEAYIEEFEEQKNVGALCKKRDESEELDVWCDGSRGAVMEIEGESSAQVAYTLRVPANVKKGEVYIVTHQGDISEDTTDAEKDDTNKDRAGSDEAEEVVVKSSTKITFEPTIKKVIVADITELRMTRNFSTYDVFGWARAGFNETYNADVTMESGSTDPLAYSLTLFVERPGEDIQEIQKTGTIGSSETVNELFEGIVMKRLGTTHVWAELTYDGLKGSQTSQTEKARIPLSPIKEIMSACGVLLFILLAWLLFRTWRKSSQEKLVDADDIGDVPQEEFSDDEFIEMPIPPRKVAKKKVARKKVARKKVARKKVAQASTKKQPRRSVEAVTRDEMIEEVEDRPLAQPQMAHSGIDIEWMREDEKVFDGAMRDQERKTNIKIGAFALVFIVVGAIAAFFVISKILTKTNTNEISIEELGEQAPEKEEVPTEPESEPVVEEVTPQREEVPAKEVAEEVVVEKVTAPAEITVKVLNGGGKVGVAGGLSTKIKTAGYKTLTPANANSAYAQTTIYHDVKTEIDALALEKVVGTTFGTIVREESASVITKHGADLVVVIGSDS